MAVASQVVQVAYCADACLSPYAVETLFSTELKAFPCLHSSTQSRITAVVMYHKTTKAGCAWTQEYVVYVNLISWLLHAGNYDEYFGMATDVEAVVYLMLMNTMIHDYFPTAITIGEDVSGMPTFCR